MAEEGLTQSIQARIRAINLAGNLDHVGRAPITANDPHALERPALNQRSQTVSGPSPLHNRASSNGIGNEPNAPRREGVLPPPSNIIRTGQLAQQPSKPPRKPAPPPSKAAPPPILPPRKQSTLPSPILPPRRTSDHLNRKASNESMSSTVSTISNISGLSNGTARTAGSRASSMDASRIKAPAYDPSSLPPLPPKRTQAEKDQRLQDIEKSKAFPGYRDAEKARNPLNGTKSTSSVATVEVQPVPTTPSLPPRRPSRPDATSAARKEQPPPMPARSALTLGMNKPDEPSFTNGRDPSPNPSRNSPPPVPLSSRPDFSKLQSTKPTPAAASSCLICRDFTVPDTHAHKFPRQSVPSLDWLATQLTSPFPSPTNQARCIFTWLHQNISYDTVSFFNNAVRPSTPASTLSSGLAVCEGYAGLFTALATKAGLQSVVIGGHGKGFGFSALQPGDPIPAESQGHTWNAVKIDHGHWKLIDPCWGAGNVAGKGQPYNKHFSPRMFTMSNEDFGLRHFPQDRRYFHRDDGRSVSWEEYVVGDPGGETLRVYAGVAEKEGISETSFEPRYLKLPTAGGGTVRFSFSRVCAHWTPERNGGAKDYVFVLAIHGLDGREDDFVAFETNGRGWWVDVEKRRLGCKGQVVSAFAVETVGGEGGRGLGVEGYRGKKGRVGMGFAGLGAWELV